MAGVQLDNSNSIIENTLFDNNFNEFSFMNNSSGLRLKNSEPSLTSSYFENNYYGIYITSGNCPSDLSGVIWGIGDNSNTIDIFPETCLEPETP